MSPPGECEAADRGLGANRAKLLDCDGSNEECDLRATFDDLRASSAGSSSATRFRGRDGEFANEDLDPRSLREDLRRLASSSVFEPAAAFRVGMTFRFPAAADGGELDGIDIESGSTMPPSQRWRSTKHL